MRWSSLLSAVAVAGCALPQSQPLADEHTDRVKLEVQNESDLDAVVYAYRYGQRYRLGLVVAHTVETVTLPLLYTDNGQAILYIHRIGETPDRDFLTNSAMVSPGSRAVLSVNPDVNASSLAVYQESTP